MMLGNESKKIFGLSYSKAGTAFVLMLMPLILLVSYPNLFITPIPTIDTWLYLGFKLDLAAHLKAFDGYYYGTRLPALIPGSIFYALFSPLAANYLDHLFFYCVSITGLYLILRKTAGPRSALVTSILLGFYCFFLMAVGWDYIDGAGISYLLVTLALLVYVRDSLWPRVLLLFAGMSFGLAVFTNLFLAIFVLVFAPFYLFAYSRHGIKKVLVGILFAGIGGALITLLLCLLNYALAGRFIFFGPSLKFATTTINQANPWKRPVADWLPQAQHLVVPAFVFLGSLISLGSHIVKRRGKLMVNGLPLESAYVLTAFIMIGWELRGAPILQLYYYASYLIPFMFPVIGLWIRPFVERMTRWHFLAFVSFAIMVLAVSLSPGITKGIVGFVNGKVVLWSIALIFLAIIILFFSRVRPGGVFLSVCILGLVHSGLCDFKIVNPRGGLEIKQSDCFLTVTKGVHLATNADSTCGIRFWYSGSERFGSVYSAISSAFCWGPRLVNERFPAVTDHFNPARLARLTPRMRVFIFSEQEKNIEEVNRALQPLNVKALQITRDSIIQANIYFKTLLIEIRDIGVTESIKSKFRYAKVLFDKSDLDLLHSLQRNCYGISSANQAIIQKGHDILYCPLDLRDHLATPFLDLQKPLIGKQSWVRLKIPRPTRPDQGSDCVLVLQDESFNELYSTRYLDPQQEQDTEAFLDLYIHIPENPNKVRIRITAKTGAETIIPRSISLSQVVF